MAETQASNSNQIELFKQKIIEYVRSLVEQRAVFDIAAADREDKWLARIYGAYKLFGLTVDVHEERMRKVISQGWDFNDLRVCNIEFTICCCYWACWDIELCAPNGATITVRASTHEINNSIISDMDKETYTKFAAFVDEFNNKYGRIRELVKELREYKRKVEELHGCENRYPEEDP